MALPTLDRVLDAIVRIDSGGAITYVSEVGLRWFGVDDAGALPASFHQCIHADDLDQFKAAMLSGPESFSCDVRLHKQDREVWTHVRGYRLSDGRQFMLCLLDISPWKIADAVLRHAAEHDELTGLPNRAALKQVVERAIASGEPFCVALLDLDGFKKVNDTFGHAMGDVVLTESARRFTKLVGDRAMVARLGGDEFVIVVFKCNADEAAHSLYDILLAIARPFDTTPHRAYIGASIGIAQFPLHGDTYAALMKNADTAMYQSKNEGKNRISVFQPTKPSDDFSIQVALNRGVEEGEFYLEFQPQFDVNRRLIGAEALMRWTSSTLGTVGPDRFIPIVEDAGLMPFLGKWALRYACHQQRRFQALMPDFCLSVNVSPIQFCSDDFDQLVVDTIAETGIDPGRLILEITESTMMKSRQRTEQALNALRDKGIRFAIDDFGTGFSNLAYLSHLPVSSLKIDRTFVRAIENPADGTATDCKLVSAMIQVGLCIGLEVVAEGVENDQQLAFLKGAGCHHVQGYLLGKPMSADKIAEVIRQHNGIRP